MTLFTWSAAISPLTFGKLRSARCVSYQPLSGHMPGWCRCNRPSQISPHPGNSGWLRPTDCETNLGGHTAAQISKICSWLPFDSTSAIPSGAPGTCWMKNSTSRPHVLRKNLGNSRWIGERISYLHHCSPRKRLLSCTPWAAPQALSSLKCQVSCWLFTSR